MIAMSFPGEHRQSRVERMDEHTMRATCKCGHFEIGSSRKTAERALYSHIDVARVGSKSNRAAPEVTGKRAVDEGSPRPLHARGA
jgi:hypothetical protein